MYLSIKSYYEDRNNDAVSLLEDSKLPLLLVSFPSGQKMSVLLHWMQQAARRQISGVTVADAQWKQPGVCSVSPTATFFFVSRCRTGGEEGAAR